MAHLFPVEKKLLKVMMTYVVATTMLMIYFSQGDFIRETLYKNVELSYWRQQFYMKPGNPAPANWTQVMEQRRNHLASVCSNTKTLANQKPRVGWTVYEPKHKFYYCVVWKIASTYWKRFAYQLIHTHPVRSPFDIPLSALTGLKNGHLSALQRTGKEFEKVLASSTKILWVRDPHSRIFASFIDKIMGPNPTFWHHWGLTAKMEYRKNLGKDDKRSNCGHDVTFEEFVKYVINTLVTRDGHVMPINNICSPCAVHYDVIGKMETFGEDSTLLFDLLHVNKTSLHFDTTAKDMIIDGITDSSMDSLSKNWQRSILKCISKEDSLRRIWRKNQIRGFISWRQNLRLTPNQISDMDSGTFTKILLEASKLSTDKKELKLQKQQAMKEAFGSILDKNLFEDLARLYEIDAKLFGFEPYPRWLDEIKDGGIVDTQALNYSIDWDLSTLL